MRRLGMVGATFRRGGQAAVEAVSFPAEERAEGMRSLHRACDFEESVYLATCNRMEVVFAGRPGVPVSAYRERIDRFFAGRPGPGETAAGEGAARRLHAYGGEGAAEHLFCVASALDSMVPGEAQILGQVKEAFQMASDLGLVGTRLGILFEEAFRAARRVRRGTGLGTGSVSMVSLMAGLVEERLEGRSGRLGLFGSGPMTRQAAQIFSGRDDVELLFVNRTASRAEHLCRLYGGGFRGLAEFREKPLRLDAVVTATSSPEPIFDRALLRSLAEQGEGRGAPLIVDLAIPRDVDREAASELGVVLHDIDRLEEVAARNRREREREVAEARMILDEALDSLRRRMVDREIAPVVRALHHRFQHTLDEGLRRLFADGAVSFEHGQRDRIERWAETLVKRFAHVPTLGLKRLSFEKGADAVEAFLQGVKDELGLERLDPEQEGGPRPAPVEDEEAWP